jgi:signal transduction histidine kinase
MTTILVVDDKEENRALIRYLFEDEPGYQVLEAADGLQGLTVAQTARPDCILLDLQMPGLSGFDVLERLEADPGTREIPVLILTATHESVDAMERALRGGAVDYITKPISPVRVGVRVRGAIERRRLLREVQELRSSFTSMLVHDLRAPIAVLTGYIDLLQQTASGPDLERQKRYLTSMAESCTRMLKLIGEILDLSKLEAGKLTLTPEPLDIAALAADIADRFVPAGAQKNVRLEIRRPADPAIVLGDRGRFEQVLMNLIVNALKFTPPGGTITVETSERGREIEVAVADTGPGIPPDEIPLLFEKFRQLGSASRTKMSGTGLGLVICRHLVEAHSGRIWAESRAGTGARFVFRLPRLGRAATAPVAPRRTSVLVVDDDPQARQSFQELLTRGGYDIEVASDGAEALEKLAGGEFSVVVADVVMPALNGLELYREVVSRQPELGDRFILVTGYRVSPEVLEFADAMGVPCLSKPFALESLTHFVSRVSTSAIEGG